MRTHRFVYRQRMKKNLEGDEKGREGGGKNPVDIGLWLVWHCLVSLCVFHFKLRLVHFHHLTRDFQIFKAQGLDMLNYTVVLKRMCDE